MQTTTYRAAARRLLPLAALLALTTAQAAQAASMEFDWRGIGQVTGVRATDVPRGSGDGWNAYAGYALSGDANVITDSGLSYGLSGTVGSGDYEKSLDRPGNNADLTLNEDANRQLIAQWTQDWSDRAQAALSPVARLALGEHGESALTEAREKLNTRSRKAGVLA